MPCMNSTSAFTWAGGAGVTTADCRAGAAVRHDTAAAAASVNTNSRAILVMTECKEYHRIVTDKDAFKERGRALEEEYFRRKEQELIAKMREKAAAETARQELGARTGVADAQLLADLQDLGYTADTISLLHVVPLVQMTWADGSVSMRERDLIIEAARARGIESGSPADQQL